MGQSGQPITQQFRGILLTIDDDEATLTITNRDQK